MNRVQHLLGVEVPIVQAPMTYIARRVLRNGLSEGIAAGDPGVRLLGRITDLYFDGDMEASVANTGQVSSRIDDVRPVAELLAEMWGGARAALAAGEARLGGA